MQRNELPKLKRDWVGRKVRTRREMRNGWGVIPAGTVMTVTRNHSGLQLESKRCACCGVSIFISKVSENAVELLPLYEVEVSDGA